MTNLDIINSLTKLNFQINTLISLLSESNPIDNNEITEDNINDGLNGDPLIIGDEFIEEIVSPIIDMPEGIEYIDSSADDPSQQITIDGEEFIDNTIINETELIIENGEELL